MGGMCSGKSTLAHGAAADSRLAGRCDVVPRWTTRPPRAGDAQDGAASIGWAEFRARVASSAFSLSWIRPVPDGSLIGYGCGHPSAPSRLPLLMAGHGIYTNAETVRPHGALDRALVVGVWAPADMRERRLHARSPDLLSDARRVRALMTHDDEAMSANVDLLVLNDAPEGPDRAIGDFVSAVLVLLDATAA